MNIRIHYAWIILLIAFITLLFGQGVRLSFGAFVNPWEEEFVTSRGIVTLISFISFIVYGVAQPFIGRLLDKFGVRTILSISILLIGGALLLAYHATSPWQLMLIYGVIASIGFGGASNIAALVAVSNWFVKKKGLAIGIVSSGIAAGQLLLVPFSIWLIEQFGWRTAIFVYAVVLLTIIFPLIYFFIRTKPSDKNLTAYGQPSTASAPSVTENSPRTGNNPQPSPFRILLKKEYLFLLLPFFVCGITTAGLIDTHLIPFAEFCGFSPTITGAAVSLLAAFNIMGTVMSGYFADRWSCKKMLIFLYTGRALTLVILLVILHEFTLLGWFIQRSHLLIIFAITFGIVDFSTIAPTVKLITDYFKNYSVGMLMGWLYFSHHVGSALGSYIPGVLYDITGGYDWTLILSIIALLLAAFLILLLPSRTQSQSV